MEVLLRDFAGMNGTRVGPGLGEGKGNLYAVEFHLSAFLFCINSFCICQGRGGNSQSTREFI